MLRTPTTKYHGEQFMEDNGLLPQNQHGFLAGGSAMSALSAIQQEWADNTEEDLITGMLLWDHIYFHQLYLLLSFIKLCVT